LSRNANLTYNPVTGANYPFTDISRLPYPDWGLVTMQYGDGWSDYHGLQTAFTKRFSHHWQASANYTLSRLKDAVGAPDVGFPVAADIGGEYRLAVGDQRHRVTFNGIWELGHVKGAEIRSWTVSLRSERGSYVEWPLPDYPGGFVVLSLSYVVLRWLLQLMTLRVR